MAQAVIRDSHLTFNGIKYFRGNAEEVELGSYGNKRTPVFGTNYLEVYKNLPPPSLAIKSAITVDIDFTAVQESDLHVSAGFKVLGIGAAVSVGNLHSKLRSGEVKLVKLSVERGDMVQAINQSPAARDQIDSLGNTARIAHQVFVVMEAKLAQTVTSTTKFDVSAEKGDVKVSIGGTVKGGGTTEVVLSEGSTFAYLLLDLEWDSPSQRKRTKVVSARDDQWGVS